MRSVIVQQTAAPGVTPRSWELGPGDAVTFGRGDGSGAVDVVLDHPEVPRIAGRIEASEDFWLLTNAGGHTDYVVENPEGGGEHVRVAPGRVRAPVPFEFARVVLPVSEGDASLLVFAPEHDLGAAARPAGGDVTARSFSLDPRAKYFRVLVALCEPRLLDPSSVAVPSLGALAVRLPDLTQAAIGFHVDYLARYKLHVVADDAAGAEDGGGGRFEEKRAALVAVALRFGLVRAEHLELLDARA
ncbi:MAG TPA: hypothetical protein VN238_13040 [Solirubrobacteraceae bacterium]|nr:hypothetical protein [Solirubrobacteraceae bacterium]